MRKQKWLLFDFDGVLVDSFDAAFTLSQHLLRTKNETEYRQLFKKSIAERLEKSLTKRALTQFFSKFNKVMVELPVVPGMKELLLSCAKEYNIAIVSSSSTAAIHRFLQRYGLDQCVAEVLGYDVEASKTIKIKSLMEQYQFSPKECMMITDTVGDIKEAVAAQVSSVAVTWGYEKEKDFAKELATIVHTPNELQKAIHLFFSR